MDFKKIAERNKIFEIRVGSHLFGTDTEESDLDLFGVFMPSEELLYGFKRCEEVDLGTVAKDETGRNTKEAVDRKLHEYRKYVRMLMQNNPNIVHTLFVNHENVVFKDREGFAQRLWQQPEMFISQEAHHRFVAYAHSQLHKMRIKPQNYKALEDGLMVLESMDGYATMSQIATVPPFKLKGNKMVQVGDLHIEGGVYVKKAKRMIEERLSKASHRTGMYTKHGFDLKFGSNLIQLLMEGIELLRTGRLEFPLAYRQDILDIKSGRYGAEEIEKWAGELENEARQALIETTLPKEPDRVAIEEFVVDEVRNWIECRRLDARDVFNWG